MTPPTPVPCPRCQAPLPEYDGVPVVVCGSCELPMSAPYLTEYRQLLQWQATTNRRLGWLHEQLLAGAVPAAGQEPPALQSHRPASAGSLLLAVGAFLLVAAGIAFIAFTWDLLGPFGQIAVLLALGAGCLWAAYRLAVTLYGTGVAVGVVGALLVSIAALGARFLGPDVVGATASLLVSVMIVVGLSAAGRWIRPRTAGVGEVAGAMGAVLVVALLASAPGDDAIALNHPWGWWSALCLLGGAGLLLAFADRMRMRSWPWVGALYIVTGSLVLAAWVADVIDGSTSADVDALAFSAAMAGAAVGVSLAMRRLSAHRTAVRSGVLVVWSIALAVAWVAAVDPQGSRGWAALTLLGVGAVGLMPGLLGSAQRRLQLVVTSVGSVAMASAVGAAIPPYVEARAELDPLQWASEAWPAWRGTLAGLAFVAVLVVVSSLAPQLAHRLTYPRLISLLPLATTGAALATWLIAAQLDLVEVTTAPGPYEYVSEPTPDAFVRQIAVALVIVALGVLVMALLRRIPAWSGWLVPALAIPAVLLELSTITLDSPLAPELVGLAVTVPAVMAALAWWWLRRPDPTPTWQTIMPPFVLAVLPSTFALLEDTTDRWWYDEDPTSAYQIRLVALMLVAVVAAVVGARQRWSGLFFPGLGLALVIVAVELLDLGRFLPQWISFGLAGAALIAAGARWEWLRNRGREGAAWVRGLR